MKNIQLVIPMSGQGTRYQAAGYNQPKPLIPVSGIPMIERLLDVFPKHWPTTFILAENHRNTELPHFLSNLRTKGKQIFIGVHKEGPGFALQQALSHLDLDAPVLVSYCDYSMIWDAEKFEQLVMSSQCDAALLSYRGFHAHYLSPTTYAYSKLEGDRVVDVKEKGSFTDNRENEYASAGAYYFKTGKILKDALEYQKKHNHILKGEMYTSLTVKALLEMNPKAEVRVFEIPYFFQWGTPEDLQIFEYWEKTYLQNKKINNCNTGFVEQLVLPMAGLGSRFKHLTEIQKPLLSINAKPMYEQALASMPKAGKTFIATLSSVAAKIKPLVSQEIISLTHTPEGQALTTELTIKNIDPTKEVIVTACDHAIVLSQEKWRSFQKSPDCDAAIFTIKGFPGTVRKPLAFSYVATEAKDSSMFPLVDHVSLKKNISTNPLMDHLLVGTFWFRSGKILQTGIDLLKKKNQRNNGELYLDIIFDSLKEIGLKSRMISLDGYINWGDSDSFAEAAYWHEVFCGPQKLNGRKKYPGIE